MRHLPLVACTALLLPLAACPCGPTGEELVARESGPVTVEGKAFYREKIMLPPGNHLYVRIVDTAEFNTPNTIREARFPAEAATIPFKLEVNREAFDPGRAYGVIADLYDVDGTMRFTTDTAVPVDLSNPQPLEIRLVPKQPGVP